LSNTSEYNTQPMKTLVEFEKEIILRALDCAKGKIRGINGAAQLLDVHPNTLDSKIKKLGIEKRYC
ncbi:MAG: helix-turn-helix domain-containing protein, partial [Bacteroidota bacterium]